MSKSNYNGLVDIQNAMCTYEFIWCNRIHDLPKDKMQKTKVAFEYKIMCCDSKMENYLLT